MVPPKKKKTFKRGFTGVSTFIALNFWGAGMSLTLHPPRCPDIQPPACVEPNSKCGNGHTERSCISLCEVTLSDALDDSFSWGCCMTSGVLHSQAQVVPSPLCFPCVTH